MDDLTLKQLIFANVLGMQYHPRNKVLPHNNQLIIDYSLHIAELAVKTFNQNEEKQSCQ
jgi:hypothetical protein